EARLQALTGGQVALRLRGPPAPQTADRAQVVGPEVVRLQAQGVLEMDDRLARVAALVRLVAEQEMVEGALGLKGLPALPFLPCGVGLTELCQAPGAVHVVSPRRRPQAGGPVEDAQGKLGLLPALLARQGFGHGFAQDEEQFVAAGGDL